MHTTNDPNERGYRFPVGTDTTLIMSHTEYKKRQQAGRIARLKWNAGMVVVAIVAIAFLMFLCLTASLIPIYLAG